MHHAHRLTRTTGCVLAGLLAALRGPALAADASCAAITQVLNADQVQYSNAIRASFSHTPLESKEARLLATDLGPFMVDAGCQAAGTEKLARRDALVSTAKGDLERGDIRFKPWIDKVSGMQLRAWSDEPEADLSTLFDALDKKKSRPPKQATPQPGAPRKLATHAYLFGDSVKPPGPGGVLDAATLGRLHSLLKGTP